jgi:quercetin dioxygenase-like cupin family protein
VSTEDATPTRRGFTIFRAADAPSLADSGIGEAPVAAPEIVAAMIGSGMPNGSIGSVPWRHEGEEGVSLVRIYFKPNYHSTRHSHNADCLYYITAGEARLGNQVLGVGDGFFVPANSPYQFQAGPDGFELLEFRTATHYDQRLWDEDLERWRPVLEAATQNAAEWEKITVSPHQS